MRTKLIPVCLAVAAMGALAGCGGAPTDGGWLATGSGWAMFLQISSGSGEVDYAFLQGSTVARVTGTVVIHNDNTLEVDGRWTGRSMNARHASIKSAMGTS